MIVRRGNSPQTDYQHVLVDEYTGRNTAWGVALRVPACLNRLDSLLACSHPLSKCLSFHIGEQVVHFTQWAVVRTIVHHFQARHWPVWTRERVRHIGPIFLASLSSGVSLAVGAQIPGWRDPESTASPDCHRGRLKSLIQDHSPGVAHPESR